MSLTPHKATQGEKSLIVESYCREYCPSRNQLRVSVLAEYQCLLNHESFIDVAAAEHNRVQMKMKVNDTCRVCDRNGGLFDEGV